MSRRCIAVAAVLVAVAGGCAHDGARAGRTPASSTSAGVGPSTSEAPHVQDDLVSQAELSHLPAFRDVPWADDLKAEQDRFDATPKPTSVYGRYTVPEFSGTYTNVRDGERVTLRLPCATCPKRTVWLLGASAAFGLGQRDEYTTASYIVRQGAAAGYDLTVRNLAVPGMTVVDEYQGLRAHLEHDGERPDLVIFMDGFNDVMAAYMYAVIRDGALLDPIRFDDTWVDEFLSLTPTPRLDDARDQRIARHVADRYAATQAKIDAVLDAAGIDHATFFQPDGFSSPLQAEGLAKSLNVPQAALAQDSDIAKILRDTVGDLGDRVTDLRQPVAGLVIPIFADTTHFNETGAQFLADRIYQEIAPLLG
jgi:lysophospholipase L1-like esterase